MNSDGEPQGGADFIPIHEVRSAPARLDLAEIRGRLAGKRGREYWRSLDELAETEEFRRYVAREFPIHAPRDMEPLSRREFFRVMGATLALAGVAGCSYQPPEKIVPYVVQPEQVIPGKPLFFTTAFQRSGYGYGILAESHTGRPTKIEGNPHHPASLGSTDAQGQGSLLSLYDPDRSQAVRSMGNYTTWEEFLGHVDASMPAWRANGGAGLRLLLEPVTSPTLASQFPLFLKTFPNARLCQYDPVARDGARDGARLAFGADVRPIYHFDRAARIVSLDCNFLQDEPGSVRYARDFSSVRRVREGQTAMNRLYTIETTTTITGANADHRLAVRPSEVEGIARALAAAVGAGEAAAGAAANPPGAPPGWIQAAARDLQANRGTSLVLAGAQQPPVVHALAHAMNEALGNAGKTVSYLSPVEAAFPGREQGLRELVDDLNAGRVDTLLILSANPVYTAPADLNFLAAVQKAKERIHFGLYDDETGVQCQWHLPESHYLEAWSDVPAYDGTVSIVQPLIQPLYDSHSVHEMLAVISGQELRNGYDIVRGYWRSKHGTDFDRFWHTCLTTGVVPGTAATAAPARLRPNVATALPPPAPPPGGATVELALRPDPFIWDGRWSNNGWLQELPRPITTLVWDNAALVSPATAQQRGLASQELITLTAAGRSLTVPVWITPGHPDGSLTLHLGYGRTRAGKLGDGMGFNAYTLRTSDAPWFRTDVQLRERGTGVALPVIGTSMGAPIISFVHRDTYPLVTFQHHFGMQGREMIRGGSLPELVANPQSPGFMRSDAGEEKELPSLFRQTWPADRRGPGDDNNTAPLPLGTYPGAAIQERGYNDGPIPAWGMVIDLTACIGCMACTIACQAENNIPTVGKDQCFLHREMHWIRVDNYFSGSPDAPEVGFQPVPCMHCEKAPCEPVCPVEATTHSAEGINEMTYNRCVGTRYCSNNCPYKVRRFNYLQFSRQETPTIEMMANPDVTVRSRGVMEKCSYCIQRISEARIQAEKEFRPIRDGDVIPACAQACPTQAIVFGDINDTKGLDGGGSHVRKLKANPLNYTMLTELNTRPRTSYLARVNNPNPELPRPARGE